MEKKGLTFAALFLTSVLLFGCTNNGTEIGNPGSKRFVTGAITASPAALTVTPRNAAVPASCPEGGGPVSVVFSTALGDEVTATANETGGFSAPIDQQQRYEVIFRQNGATCAELYYGSSDPHAGLHVVLGKGDQDIDLGAIEDQGNGIYVSNNAPSDFCDDDGDGIPDSKDADADGDGTTDTDGNDDGYIDWFTENEATEQLP